MTSLPRRTVARRATVEGIGLHLGEPCRLTLAPAPVGAGRTFVRTDRPGSAPVPASVAVAQLSARRTQLGTGDDALHTVEHVLAALAGADVDDVVIELTGPEPPVGDGSAAPFTAALAEAGIVEHGGTADVLTLAAPVRVEDGASWYEASPHDDGLALSVEIAFPHPLIRTQAIALDVTPASFGAELSAARTFGFVEEVEGLRAQGLIRGASLDNAVVLDAAGLVPGASLRWPDEFVRHKALDCVGDLALAGARVRARVRAHRPSHRGTVLLVRELVRQARLSPIGGD